MSTSSNLVDQIFVILVHRAIDLSAKRLCVQDDLKMLVLTPCFSFSNSWCYASDPTLHQVQCLKGLSALTYSALRGAW